jgi:hypothetical protein
MALKRAFESDRTGRFAMSRFQTLLAGKSEQIPELGLGVGVGLADGLGVAVGWAVAVALGPGEAWGL